MKASSTQAACVVWGLHLYHLQCEWPCKPTSQASLQWLSRSHVCSKAVFSGLSREKSSAVPNRQVRTARMLCHHIHAMPCGMQAAFNWSGKSCVEHPRAGAGPCTMRALPEHPPGCFPVPHLGLSLFSGARCRQLLGRGHCTRGPWVGLLDELISFETLNWICLPHPSLCCLPTVRGCRGFPVNRLFHRHAGAQQPSPGTSASLLSLPSM